MKRRMMIDAIIDIAILAALIFIVMAVINNPFARFGLVLVACGAMYNNFKYVFAKKDKEQIKEEVKQELKDEFKEKINEEDK